MASSGAVSSYFILMLITGLNFQQENLYLLNLWIYMYIYTHIYMYYIYCSCAWMPWDCYNQCRAQWQINWLCLSRPSHSLWYNSGKDWVTVTVVTKMSCPSLPSYMNHLAPLHHQAHKLCGLELNHEDHMRHVSSQDQFSWLQSSQLHVNSRMSSKIQ